MYILCEMLNATVLTMIPKFHRKSAPNQYRFGIPVCSYRLLVPCHCICEASKVTVYYILCIIVLYFLFLYLGEANQMRVTVRMFDYIAFIVLGTVNLLVVNPVTSMLGNWRGKNSHLTCIETVYWLSSFYTLFMVVLSKEEDTENTYNRNFMLQTPSVSLSSLTSNLLIIFI